MSRTRYESREQRRLRFEQFEQRLVMSAQAVGALLPELEIAAPALTQQVVAHPLLNSASATTQAAEIAGQYGFDGSGQTVAVIDSGIAWDHYALGNGFGEGHKVVGGWDFAENDANPYDDGPAGFHGTHVAGIVGSEDSQYRGVASGADLVALRVFTDAGGGDLAWVEQALRWVHEHKDDFANPITTVNLSLGTDWNAFDLPDWASLEDEFAQLKADGLFISVAAGNDFRSYGEPGLSYPAVSEHVVPVASHDANGMISGFSQRAANVLVAPGESIKSTVPDHLFGGTSAGQFLGSSGTSMSAPYVAGASAILRQANEFMGTTGITQDMLYQQFRQTADQIYDQVTGGFYYKINLEAALAAVVTDLHSDQVASATRVGAIQGGEKIGGTIGKTGDVDQFSFQAVANGQVRLQLDSTHDLAAMIEVLGNQATYQGNEVTLSVEAGKQYNFSVSSALGHGHYSIGFEFEAGAAAKTWGQVNSATFAGEKIDGEAMYKLEASRDGFLTVQAEMAGAHGQQSITLEIFDAQMNRVARRTGTDLRLDVIADKSETFYVKATGNATVDFQIDNLVSLKSGQLSINGTRLNDSIIVDTNSNVAVSVNGLDYRFEKSAVQTITVDGQQGSDRMELRLGGENDSVVTRSDGLNLKNHQFQLRGSGLETIQVDGGGGYNTVSMQDTAGKESLNASTESSTLVGAGFATTVSNFDIVFVQSSGGNDSASFVGDQHDDLFVSKNNRHTLHGKAAIIVADQFSSVVADGRGGNDRAILFDSTGRDQFVLAPTFASVTSGVGRVNAAGFETVNAIGGRGNDSMRILDSAGDDSFRFENGVAIMTGSGFTLVSHGFGNIQTVSTGGFDQAQIFDTASNDQLTSSGDDVELRSAVQTVVASGFDRVNAVAKYGGFDRAIVIGTQGDDILNAEVNGLTLTSSTGQVRRAIGFEESEIDLLGGVDFAFFSGSQGNERLDAGYADIEFETTLQLLRVANADHTSFDGNGGVDEVRIREFESLDLLESVGDKAKAYLRDRTVAVEEIAFLEAQTVDRAIADYEFDGVGFLYMLRGTWKTR